MSQGPLCPTEGGETSQGPLCPTEEWEGASGSPLTHRGEGRCLRVPSALQGWRTPHVLSVSHQAGALLFTWLSP